MFRYMVRVVIVLQGGTPGVKVRLVIVLQGGSPGVKSDLGHGVTQHLEFQEPCTGVHGGAAWSGGVPLTPHRR